MQHILEVHSFLWLKSIALCVYIYMYMDFPGGSDGKASAYNVGDPGSIPGSGRSLGKGNGNPLQYSFLENPMDGGIWQATVHGVTESDTTEQLHFHFHIYIIYTFHILFMHLSVDGFWDCFYMLAIMNNAAMNTNIQVSLLVSFFSSLRYISKCRI